MRQVFSLFFILAIACSQSSSAQAIHPPRGGASTYKTTTLSPLEDAYNVTHLKLDLSLTNLSTALSGTAITTAKVTAATGLSQYAFELSPDITLDSLRINGQLTTATVQTNGLRIAALPAALPLNAVLTAQAWYHGTPPSGTGFFTRGVINSTLGTGTKMTWTLSDPYLAKDWWPCKQSLVDKIDSADLWFTIPTNCSAGSNGSLLGIFPGIAGQQFRWKTRYPIEYYLLSVSVAPFVDRSSYMHYTDGSGDSTLIKHYLVDTTGQPASYYSALDSTGYTVDQFSKLFGRYPFWQEKYGHCLAPLGGGMEHQTMTTLGIPQTNLIAHELGHQWWGDHVTYNSWADIWLSEGFASYCEQLFIEKAHSPAAAQAYRTTVFNQVMSAAGGAVYVDDTTNVYRIFDNRLTYDKGAAVAHMLRFVAPTDAAYFTALQTYQQQYANRTATTSDLKAVVQTIYGYNPDTFFNQWVYGEGYPTYSGRWNQLGNTVLIRLTQTTSKPASIPLFHTPLELRVSSATGDTTIRVYNNAANQIFTFTWDKAVTGFVIDPSNHILNKVSGPLSQDPALSIRNNQASGLIIYPNPATGSWQVDGLPAGSGYSLYSALGLLVKEGTSGGASLTIDAKALAAGIYVLRTVSKDGATQSVQLLRN